MEQVEVTEDALNLLEKIVIAIDNGDWGKIEKAAKKASKFLDAVSPAEPAEEEPQTAGATD